MAEVPTGFKRMIEAFLAIKPEDVENAPEPDTEELNRPIVVRPEQDTQESSDQ